MALEDRLADLGAIQRSLPGVWNTWSRKALSRGRAGARTRLQLMLTARPEPARHVIAFDGDDTLWANDAAQRDWERKCRLRNIEGLPHPGMSEAFRRYLREFGCASDGVARALEASCREMSAGELPSHWLAQVAAVPEMAEGLNLRRAKGVERVLDGLKHAGYALWLITKGDLIRQAIKLSCFPFLSRFEVVEIVDRKNASVYRRVLAANSCPPDMFTMVGDGFRDDIVPVLRVGGRAVHVVGNRPAVLTSLERALPISRLGVCRHLEEVPDALGSRAAAFESACMHNAG